MSPIRLIGLVAATLLVLSPHPGSPWADSFHREYGYIPMEDGTRLAYVLYRPSPQGKFPLLLTYGPYLGGGLDLDIHEGYGDEARDYLSHGYAVMSVGIRGTGCSEGVFDILSERETGDGVAAVEWAGVQPWCDGNVGLFGNSYTGVTQYLIAPQRPKYLKAMAAGAAPGDLYLDSAYPGGIFNFAFFSYWSFNLQPFAERWGVSARLPHGDPDCQELRKKQRPNSAFHQMKAHPFHDSWWQARSFERTAASIDVPVLIIQAWQDQQISVMGATRLFENIPAPKKMLLSNGSHGFYSRPLVHEERIRWFDRWLKGKKNGIDQEPPVTIWFEHSRRNEKWAPGWVEHYPAWPVPGIEWRELYLTAQGQLSGQVPEGESAGARRYIYPAGTELITDEESFALAPAAFGALVYQTRPVPRDVTLVGSAVLNFYLSSENVDTDFMVTLHDIHLDGKVQYLQRGFLRASHRALDPKRSSPRRPQHPHDRSEPLVPGEIYEIQIRLDPVGHVVREGHRLELAVMAPSSIPAPNWGFAPIMLPGVNTVYHSSRYPSRLALPVIPGASARAAAPPCGSLPNQPCRNRSVTPALGVN